MINRNGVDYLTPKRNKGFLTYIFIIIIAVFCIYFVSSKFADNAEHVDYTSIIKYFDEYRVSFYELDLGTGELKYALDGEDVKKTYNVPNVEIFLMDTEGYRQAYNEIIQIHRFSKTTLKLPIELGYTQ